MISYATVDLSEPDGTDVDSWIQENVRPEEIFPLIYRAWPGMLTNGPILNNTPEEKPHVTTGKLTWPWGASRFARAHFIISKKQLDDIRAKVIITNNNFIIGKLKFDDGESSISTNMWMLPAIPIQQSPSDLGIHLLTLVDSRYWWWGTPITTAIIPNQTTWSDLFVQIGTALALTIDNDPIADDYGKPPIEYAADNCHLPAVLDAVAWSVGQRIVRDIDGSVSSQSPTTAQATVAANQARGFNLYAGGVLDFNPRK